ncbi:MAG TPA: AAA family ATPase [Ktedonobacteraceae bacterium]|nr:AAA family ATPase [Ktedonobacteraceae bacterium]
MQAPFADPLLGIDQFPKALPLVDREAEMQLLRMLLNTVFYDMPHGPRVLTMSGEVGVGKSRLLAEIYTEAQTQGFRVLEGRAYETGNMVPYLPFIEILRPVIRSSSEKQLRTYVGLFAPLAREQVAPLAREHDESSLDTSSASTSRGISLVGIPMVTVLARLFPELPKLLHITVAYEMLSPDQEKFRLLDAIATLIERIALEQPVLLSIDNLQWADSASLELTAYLTVRLHDSRVALMGSTRPPQSVSDWTESDDPFFLEELVRMLTLNRQVILRDGKWQATRSIDRTLPESITAAVRQRLQGLSNGCRELLRVASLFGRTFPLDALLEVLHMTHNALQPLLDEATGAALIAQASLIKGILDDKNAAFPEEDNFFSLATANLTNVVPTSYLFCQGIVQEVLSAEMPQQRVRVLHAALGTALEAFYGKAAPAHAAEMVRHYALSGEKEATLRWSLLAAEDAATGRRQSSFSSPAFKPPPLLNGIPVPWHSTATFSPSPDVERRHGNNLPWQEVFLNQLAMPETSSFPSLPKDISISMPTSRQLPIPNAFANCVASCTTATRLTASLVL